MRRTIYECRACGRGYCTVRTRSDEKPSRCVYWHDFSDWVRIDKHEQKQLGEFRSETEPQEWAGLGRGLY